MTSVTAAPLRPPRPLAPRAKIVVIAPSSPVDWRPFWAGVAWLRTRYRVEVPQGTRAAIVPPGGRRTSFLAGTDDARAETLLAALAGGAAALFAARGGYGAPRIVDAVAPALAAWDGWLVGFSDVTSLHAARVAAGWQTLHAPNISGLATARPRDRLALLDALEGRPHRPIPAPLPLAPGEAEGILVGGNLTLVHAEVAAGRFVCPPGAIVALEDVGERPYRLDRALATLLPALGPASAVVFGDFDDCRAGPDGVPVDAVLADFAGRFGRPVVAGLPFGHGARNTPLPLGARARLAGGQLRLLT